MKKTKLLRAGDKENTTRKTRERLLYDCLGVGILEELLEDGEALGLLPVVGDDDAGALDNLAGGALGVELAEAGPLAELHSLGHADEVHVDLVAERLDELGVVSLVAVLGKDAQKRLAGLDGLFVRERVK